MASTNDIIGLLMLVAVGVVMFALIPVIGYNVDSATTIPGWANESDHAEGGKAGSSWNATVNTAVVTGTDLWEVSGGLVKVLFIIAIVAVALYFLIVKLGGGGGGSGGI